MRGRAKMRAGMDRKAGTTLAGVAAVVLAGWATGATPRHTLAQTPAQNGQQQQVPDAPRPQALPSLNGLTPVAPAVPNAPAPTATTAPATPDAPVPSAPQTPVGDNNLGAQIETPAAGHGAADVPSEDTTTGPASRSNTIIVYSTFVEVPFIVKDSRGQMVPGITPRDVQVYENNVRQPIRYWTTDPFPLSVALVIDQSVTFDTMERINAALGAVQGAFAAYDEMAVFTYNNGVKLQDPEGFKGTGFDGASTPRLGAVLENSKGKGREPNMALGGPLSQTTNINNQYADPNTSPNHRTGNVYEYPERDFHTLNDAILAAAQQVAKAGEHRRRIVYVISDGKEYGSKAKEKDVIKYCQTNKIAVYATLVGDSSLPVVGFLDRIHLPLTMRDNALPRYTAATGGQLDAEAREKGIEQSFARISEEARDQYFLGFYSKLPPLSEKFRTLDVRVLRPNLNVIAKEGYYPNATPSRPTAPPAQTAKPVQRSNPATSQ